MAYTNRTPNYQLPQYIGADKPTFAGDINSAFSTIDQNLYAAATNAKTAADISGNNATSIEQINGQINTINDNISNINTNLTATTNVANNALSLKYKTIATGTLFTGLGSYLSNFSPVINTNTTEYTFFTLGGCVWLRLRGESNISWTGTPESTQILNINSLDINPQFKSLIDNYVDYVLPYLGLFKVFTGVNMPNVFSPLYYKNGFVGDNKNFPVSGSNIIIRPFITYMLKQL